MLFYFLPVAVHFLNSNQSQEGGGIFAEKAFPIRHRHIGLIEILEKRSQQLRENCLPGYVALLNGNVFALD